MNKIDLTKNQLVTEDVKVLVADKADFTDSKERYLLAITDYGFLVWNDGLTGSDHNFNTQESMGYKYAKHLPEKEQITDRLELMAIIDKWTEEHRKVWVRPGKTYLWRSLSGFFAGRHDAKDVEWTNYDPKTGQPIGEVQKFYRGEL